MELREPMIEMYSKGEGRVEEGLPVLVTSDYRKMQNMKSNSDLAPKKKMYM